MLSVCIIAKNEENNIRRCLESVKNIAGEIVFVDTGSEDSTLDIVARYGCRVFETIWNNDFADMRNFSLSKASGEFILYIDADEELINPETITDCINNADNNTGGFYVLVKSQSPQVGQYYTNYQVRLFKNNPKIKFKGIIHEQIIPTIINNGFTIKKCDIQIMHYGYAVSREVFIKKQVRNLKILKKALEQQPESNFYRFNLAKTYFALEDYPNAEKEIRKSLESAKNRSLELVSYLNYGALIANKLSYDELALDRALESVQLMSKQFLANFIAGDIYFNNQNYSQATKYYRQSLENNYDKSNNYLIGDIVPDKAKVYYKTGLSFLKINEYENAIYEFEKGLEYKPDDLQNYVGLANAYYKMQNFHKAYSLLLKAKTQHPNVNSINEFISKVSKIIETQAVTIKNNRIRDKSQPLLTLSMIVKNEEKFLNDCLESVAGIADEIVIVDTGSTDRTKEIAGKYTDKIFDFEWIDDFSAARNKALQNSNGKWILYMDADERIHIKNKEIFKNMLYDAEESIGALIVTIESDHKKLDGSAEKHRGGYPRIFRNYGYPKIQFKGRVHEQIAPSILELEKSFINTDIIIEHLGYNREYDEMDKKVRRNYRLLLQHVKEEPLNSYAWYQLGQTLAHMKLNQQAEESIKFAIHTGNLSDSVYASATATLAQMEGNKKNFAKSLHYANESLKKAPDQIYSLNLRAYSLLYLGKFDEAETDFVKVLNLMKQNRGVPKTGFDIDIPENIPLKGLEKARNRDNLL